MNPNNPTRYFSLSAKNGDNISHFMLGVIYSQGIYIDKDRDREIEEAIHHYNYGFNIRNDYSENNL